MIGFIAPLLASALTLAPVLTGGGWANVTAPPATDGRVTLVDVFAFSCINCRHVTPELQHLRREYGTDAVTIIGVHTPELPEERVHANLRAALADQGISWPVVYDDDSRIWNAYGVTAWPTQLLFDKHGRLRERFVGEGYDAEIERAVRTLVAER
ncbi:MAG TPA: redoxin family protein [Candidatus Sulfotelmatobacter sp.]|nr:redoxin family protein [Candidatus Sulfotelmatobacter sp.]